MSDLPRDFRRTLSERAFVGVPEVERRTPSQDGSEKIVFALSDGARVQSVLMPDGDRLTLCVSTQVGCGFGCAFCFTGTMGLERNLGAGEIVGQVIGAARMLAPGQRLTHIVYMGMGEPLANYQATVQSLRILTDPAGFAMSPRRITVSTVGLVGGIERLAGEASREPRHLAPRHEQRDSRPDHARQQGLRHRGAARRLQALPAAVSPADDVRVRAARGHQRRAGGRAAARAASEGHPGQGESHPVQRLGGIALCPAALAPHHRVSGHLLEHGITATVRWSKGEDIGAACGQLREAVPA